MDAYTRLRWTGILEGISFLVLMGIAMPLKYLYDQPMAVKVVGWLHGILFIGFLTLAFLYKEDNKLSWRWLIGAGMAALLPFGPFVWERRYLQPVAEESRR